MQLRLFLLQPAVVFRAQVNQAIFEYPLAEVAWDGLTLGAIANIQPGMTVVFGSSLGVDDLGRQRIRKAATVDTLYFGRSSRGMHDGEVDLADNAWIEVWDDYRVWAKIPQMPVVGETVVTYKDHDLAVGTNTTAPPPVANCGPGYAATSDPITDLITVDFDASNSFAIAGGASISGYSWDVDDGTITVGTSSSAQITATFPAGFRWVSLTVTDSNGKSHTARAPVYARDPSSDTSIHAFEITRHTITPQGQQISLRILEDIPATTYPDGTLVLFWDDDTVTADRDHMQFVGWHHTDPAQIAGARTGTLRDVTLECLDVAGKLAMLPGFPQALYADSVRDTATTPTITWEYMISPTIRKYLHYLLHWHSTALDLADFRFRGVSTDYPFLVLESSGASLFDQVDSRAQQLTPDHRLTCTRRGQLAVWPDPMLLDPVDRTEVYQGEITQNEWVEMRYSHQRPPRVYWLRAGAIVAQDTPVYRADGELDIPTVFCVAPGTAPGQGEIQQEENERLALNQDALNHVTGHRYARLNSPDSRFTIQLVGDSDLALEPADLEWVRVYLSPDVAAQRGQYFETMAGILLLYFERGLVHSIDIRYSHSHTGLLRTATLEWEREVVGTPAVTVIPPVAEPADDYDPFPPDRNPPTLTLLGDSTLFVQAGDAFVDPGATASDIEDGDITADIVVGGDTVDLETEGVYTLTYNVSDSAGNAATQVTRTVRVVPNSVIDILQEWILPGSELTAGTYTLPLDVPMAMWDVFVLVYMSDADGAISITSDETGLGNFGGGVDIYQDIGIGYVGTRLTPTTPGGVVGAESIKLTVTDYVMDAYLVHLRGTQRTGTIWEGYIDRAIYMSNTETPDPCDVIDNGGTARSLETNRPGTLVVVAVNSGAWGACGDDTSGFVAVDSNEGVNIKLAHQFEAWKIGLWGINGFTSPLDSTPYKVRGGLDAPFRYAMAKTVAVAIRQGYTYPNYIEWWKADELNAANVKGAYSAHRAATLAESYVNLANPGTDNLTAGVAPVLSAGWVFDGSTSGRYLITGFVPTQSWSMVAAFSGCSTGSVRYIAGVDGTIDQRFGISPRFSSTQGAFDNGGELSHAVPIAAATMALAGNTGYINITAVSGTIPVGSGLPGTAIWIGGLNGGGSLVNHFYGTLTHIAFFDTTLTEEQIIQIYEQIQEDLVST